MKTRYISLLAIAGLLLPAATYAADDAVVVNGHVALGVRGVSENNNSAKFQEYRDLDDGLFGKIVLDAYQGKYHFEMKGKNVGLDDQSYLLKGGRYGDFKYSFFYDETPHNYSFDAKTPHSGVGTRYLDFSGTVPAEQYWSTFDYSIKRKKYGANVEASLGSPFYFGVGASRMEMNGLRPLSSGSFSGTVEMPEPISTQTSDVTLKAGYRSETLVVGITGLLSSFNNDNLFLKWKNPSGGAEDLNTLAPENDYGNIAANIAWKKLPYASTLAVRGSYSKLENDFTLSDLSLTAPAGLNTTQFDGDIKYTDFSAALTSMPMPKLDTKVYYTYLKKKNDSTEITYTGDGNSEDIFGYKKNKGGLDIGYRLPMSTKLQAGYEYYDIDRTNRTDAESTTDNSVFLELKNSHLEYLTAKVKYKHLKRDSDFGNGAKGAVNTDAEYIERFVRRFDATDKSMDEVKLGVELYPIDAVDVGLEYTYQKNDYDDIVLGRTDDKANKFYLDVMCRLPQSITVSAFGGFENQKAGSNHLYAGGGDPVDPITLGGNAYRWTEDLDDDFYTFGLTGKMPLMDNKLNLIANYEWQKSSGKAEFTTQGAAAPTLQNIDGSSDYRKDHLEAKAVYAFAKNLDVALGYIYEKYKLTDFQWAGYDYIVGSTYNTGAYSDHDYEANVGYLYMKYNF